MNVSLVSLGLKNDQIIETRVKRAVESISDCRLLDKNIYLFKIQLSISFCCAIFVYNLILMQQSPVFR